MGLAASQARLLSITSRMSDNELRSQLINNAKMRLTSDSARVSDEYVAALNKTQMMFSNFDVEGNPLYQALTFNSLTAYSAYNNQYGIVNRAGEIIVSAEDAAYFEAANGSLSDFLGCYGLEQTTTYFDELKSSNEYHMPLYDKDGNATNQTRGIGYYDDNGVWQNIDVTVDELQAIYEGTTLKNIVHYGQDGSLNSPEYAEYEKLVDDYNTAKGAYFALLETTISDFFRGKIAINGKTFVDNNNKTLNERYKALMNDYGAKNSEKTADDDTWQNIDNTETYFNNFQDFTSSLGLIYDTTTNKFVQQDPENSLLYPKNESPLTNSLIETLNYYSSLYNAAVSGETTIKEYSFKENQPYPGIYVTVSEDADKNKIYQTEVVWGTQKKYLVPDENGDYYSELGQNAKLVETEPTSADTYYEVYIMPPEDENHFYADNVKKYTDTNGTVHYVCKYDPDYSSHSSELTPVEDVKNFATEVNRQLRSSEKTEALISMYQLLETYVMYCLDYEKFDSLDEITKAKEEYEQNATKLAQFIWGYSNGENAITRLKDDSQILEYDKLKYLDDPKWVLSTNHSSYALDNNGVMEIGELSVTHYNPIEYQTSTIGSVEESGNPNYQVVKDLFILDCMMEHYGMPNYTWIDKNNKNEDAQAKATWYSNLFAKMQEGYEVIGNGLANNKEWLQYAFESGLVHLEQVSQSQWRAALYSNCSNITESTVDVDVTLAEAKYKREMNKIESKDKQYDMELKNIDTEHESLKQELESIKKVIGNNIKNNYKLFQNG